MSKLKPDYDIVRPQPESVLESARAFGYSVETAIADLIDNSITARASRIKITFGIDRYSSHVRIEDNGKGMNEKELINAMRIGSFNPAHPRHQDDLGRFGLGLKTASFSQGRRLTVKTRNAAGKEFIRCWDLDLVEKKKDWVLLRNCADRNSEKNIGQITAGDTGTVILWEKLDRLVESHEKGEHKEHFYRKFGDVRMHLGIVFHRFIEEKQIAILVQGDEVAAINPFNISPDFPSVELAEEQLSINGQDIIIQPYVLPHESKLSQDEKQKLEIVRGWTEHQGIYLYRNKRLIADGSWLDLDFRKKESQRLCRIRIDIPNTLDKEWQIDIKKESAKIPDVLRSRIRNICFSAIEKAIKVYTHRGAYIRRLGEKKELVYLWKIRQKKGKRYYEINQEHPIYQLLAEQLAENGYIFKDYIRLIGESLPVSAIVNDFSDPAITLREFFEESKAELKQIFDNTVSALVKAGVPEKEALERVLTIDCFQQLNSD